MIDSVIDNIDKDIDINHSVLLLPFRIKNKALSVRRGYDVFLHCLCVKDLQYYNCGVVACYFE